jgi:cation transport ATPase
MGSWKVWSVLALALGSGLTASPGARADVKAVQLGVKGATCATCAFALRKAFKNLNGVADATLTIKQAVMQVRMKPGLWPDLPRMQRTIREAGFEAKNAEVDLVVTGTLRKDGEKLVVDLAGMKTAQAVAIDPGAAGTEVAAQLNHLVELKGRWKPVEGSASGEGMLSIISVQPQK